LKKPIGSNLFEDYTAFKYQGVLVYLKMGNDKFIQTFFKEDKFDQRTPFPRKGKPKSRMNLIGVKNGK
jgi:hypothetical protein